MSGVNIRVRADTSQARNDLKKLENSVSKIESATSRLGQSIKAAVATYGAFLTTGSIIKIADQFQGLENQLRVVQKEGESVAGTFAKLNRLSINSRTSLADTVQTYSRLGRALERTNLSQQDYLDVTEAINKATKIGGQPLATQQAALFQLSQAFASGTLRGEEFNSVSEGAPEILRALRTSLDVTQAELRELAFDGKITSQILTESLLTALPDIRDEFDILIPLVSELTQIMQQEFFRAIKELDRLSGVSVSFGQNIQLLTTAFSFFADNASFYVDSVILKFLDFRIAARSSIEAVSELISGFFSGNFTIENFSANLDAAKASVVSFFQDDIFKVEQGSFLDKLMSGIPLFTVDNIIEGTTEALSKITTFVTNVIAAFFSILDEVILNSSWSGLFWKGVDRIGGPKLDAGLREAFNKISSWASAIKEMFSDLSGSVSSALKNLFLGQEQLLPNGETVRINGLFSFIPDAIGGSNLEEGLKTAESKINSWTDSVKKIFEDMVSPLTSLDFSLPSFKDLIYGEEQTLPNGQTFRTGGVQETLLNSKNIAKAFAEGLSSFVVENKWILGGTAFAGAILFALNSELRNSLLQGLFLGAGYVIGAGILAAITSPIGLFVSAIAFGPSLLDSANSAGLTRQLGVMIADGLEAFFLPGGEGESTFERIISAIVRTAGQLGEGLFEGFDLGDSFVTALIGENATKTIVSLLGAAFAAISITGVLRFGILGAGLKLSGALFSWLTGASITALIGAAFGAASSSAGDSRIDSFGRKAGRIFESGFRAATAGLVVNSLSDALFGSDGELTKAEDQTGDVAGAATSGAVLGATVGSIIPGVGTAIGAAVGALTGAIVGIFVSPELQSAINNWAANLGTSIKEAIIDGVTSGFDAVKDTITNFLDSIQGFKPRRAATDPGLADTSVLTPMQQIELGLVPNGLAGGGLLRGPGGPKDDLIPAMLSNGEFVVQASAVDKFGTGFLSAINEGVLPGFANGSGDSRQAQEFLNQIAIREGDVKRYNNLLDIEGNEDDPLITQALNKAKEGLATAQANYSQFTTGESAGAGAFPEAPGDTDGKKEKSLGRSYAERFQDDFQSGFSEAIKTGDFGGFGRLLVDSFTSNIIDSFAQDFTESLFSGLIGGKKEKDGPLSKIFDFGFKTNEEVAKKTKSTSGEESEGLFAGFKSSLSGLFSGEGGLLSGFKNLFSGLTSSLSGLFGGGGLGSLFSGIGSFFGFSEGGIVPSISGSVSGRDSVPAMLTPGELVVPKKSIDDFMKNTTSKGSTTQSFSINVQGDVSRQTRQEIVKMIPQITSGVNMTNKEQGRR